VDRRPGVLTFVRYYLPGYKSGGPVRTIANLVDHLGEELDFRIVTSDRDALDDGPYSNIAVDAWMPVGKARVYYASPAFRSARRIARLIADTPHDILYINSFFDPVFTLYPLLARRLGWLQKRQVVIAPRGEFSPGALALKRWKKLPYRWATRALGLYSDLAWQASSEYEVRDIRRIIGKTARNIMVAPNLPPATQDTKASIQTARRSDGAPLRLVFLSRVSPKKNLDFALRVLSRVRVPVVFDIYGIVDDERYWQLCAEQIAAMPNNVTVQYHGVVEHHRVASILADYDLLLLPTRGENYGHVIYETLAAGTPALISDQTPWRDLDEVGVGWVRRVGDLEAFVEVINALAELGPEKRRLQREHARLYASRVTRNRDTVTSNLALFSPTRDAVGRI
jgi:glycosyltransferase involved in cell wall biosynthesis